VPKKAPDGESRPIERRAREQRVLVRAVVVFLVLAGGAAVAVVYGPSAALASLPFLLAGAGVIGLVWMILNVIERLAD
jgi:hypothetical protein